jgi:CRISPR-associated endonuclease Cas2
MSKKNEPLGFVEKMKKINRAGLNNSPPANRYICIDNDMPTLTERVEKLMGIIKREKQNPLDMIYFVMYDIEDNKVRTQVAKYLIKKGCTRVQKSIFIANTNRQVFDEIQSDLKEVQQCYDNSDSVMLVPVSTDEIRAMKLIGQNIDFDLALKNRNTLFF